MITETELTRATKAALKEFSTAYTRREPDRFVALLDKNAFVLGTGQDEVARGAQKVLKMAQRDWAQSDSATMKIHDIHAAGAGDVAWCDAAADLHIMAGREAIDLEARITAVMAQTGGSWHLVQVHMSAPLSTQPEGESWPAPGLAIPEATELTSGHTLVH